MNDRVDELFSRARELQDGGLDWLQAVGRANLENLIAQWPSGWGDDFQVLLYGDFDPPGADLEFEHLGISVLHEPVEKSVIRGAMTVLLARVTVAERSVDALVDAIRRLNILLGAWTLVTWSNSAVGWWAHITHSFGGGTKESLDHKDLPTAVDGITKLPESIRPKVDAALFWKTRPGRSFGRRRRSRSDRAARISDSPRSPGAERPGRHDRGRPFVQRGVQESVQVHMQKGCESHFQASHPWRTYARDYGNLVKVAAYGRAPKAGALPSCATPRISRTIGRSDSNSDGLVT